MHNHNHGHHHDHQHIAAEGTLKWIYILSITLNLLFVIIEAGIGIWSGSLGLLSDAGHNLGDVFSLALALLAFFLSSSKATKRYTYGYRKASVLISLLNAIILLAAVGAILAESIHKMCDIQSINVNGAAVSWTAGAGIIINGLTAWLLMKKQDHDVNTRGAFLHMLADTLVSAGVLVSGVIITRTGWAALDPIVSIIIAIVILISTWSLLAESFRLSIDAVPEGIDPDEISGHISGISGVVDVHHIHIWPISTTDIAMTAHVVISDVSRMAETVATIKKSMHDHGISHCTIETEQQGCECGEHECNTSCCHD